MLATPGAPTVACTDVPSVTVMLVLIVAEMFPPQVFASPVSQSQVPQLSHITDACETGCGRPIDTTSYGGQ
jgi:hypothetical protein